MIAAAYLLPLFACLVLNVGFHFRGEWSDYLFLFLTGEVVVAALHYTFYYFRTHAEEYVGSIVKSLHYEAPWTELVPQTVTRRDSRGNTYTTVQIRHVYHPEKYYFTTTRGSSMGTDAGFFYNTVNLWGVSPERCQWVGSRIRGGVRYGLNASMPSTVPMMVDDVRWVSVTEPHNYKNKIRNSNSIFKHRRISRKEARELGLYDYPAIVHHDAPAILSKHFPVAPDVFDRWRRFNGYWAPSRQMRVYILLFKASHGVGIAEMQRAYWQGGNKNEFVVCIGLDDDGTVDWARVFSWADSQQLEVETADWLVSHGKLDLHAFHSWFVAASGSWKRKEFADFNYLLVPLRLWQVLTLYAVSIAENALFIYILLSHH